MTISRARADALAAFDERRFCSSWPATISDRMLELCVKDGQLEEGRVGGYFVAYRLTDKGREALTTRLHGEKERGEQHGGTP